MRFKDLLNFVEQEFQEPPVRFGRLRDLVNMHHKTVAEVVVHAISYNPPNSQAHFVLIDKDHLGRHEDEMIFAGIRYCDSLDEAPGDRRFALTKELMHVFDSDEEMTDTRERFVQLMRDIQNTPMSQHASPMYLSEINTKWMAAIVLCPPSMRAQLVSSYADGSLKEAEIAARLQVPRIIIPDIMDEYYEVALSELLKK